MAEIRIYCDETCHLENDGQSNMGLGALFCPADHVQKVVMEIKSIKDKYGKPYAFELKWNKVSSKNLELYKEVIQYFFRDGSLKFRGIVAEKTGLDHERFSQTHNDWYYKMLFRLIHPILHTDDTYRIFLDKKDSWGGIKVKKLHEVICNSQYDFSKEIVTGIQIVDSLQVLAVQLADLLIGALVYAQRPQTKNGSHAKQELIQLIRTLSGKMLNQSTLLSEEKFNIFKWTTNYNE